LKATKAVAPQAQVFVAFVVFRAKTQAQAGHFSSRQSADLAA
jgi:hypothetical protein